MTTEDKIQSLLTQELERPQQVRPTTGNRHRLRVTLDSLTKHEITYCCCINDCYGNYSSNGYCPCLRSGGGFATQKQSSI